MNVARLLFCIFLFTSSLLVHAQDVEKVIRHCPGGALWMNAEIKRQIAREHPSPAIPNNKIMRAELLKMANDDQIPRKAKLRLDRSSVAYQKFSKMQSTIDKENLRRIREIVMGSGFPSETSVGTDGVAAAWLLIQHADLDPLLQAKVLHQIAEGNNNSNRSGVTLQQVALLTDAVRISQGERQLYGTKGDRDQKSGKFHLAPVEDYSHLNERRARMGMMPIETDLCVRADVGY